VDLDSAHLPLPEAVLSVHKSSSMGWHPPSGTARFPDDSEAAFYYYFSLYFYTVLNFKLLPAYRVENSRPQHSPAEPNLWSLVFTKARVLFLPFVSLEHHRKLNFVVSLRTNFCVAYPFHYYYYYYYYTLQYIRIPPENSSVQDGVGQQSSTFAHWWFFQSVFVVCHEWHLGVFLCFGLPEMTRSFSTSAWVVTRQITHFGLLRTYVYMKIYICVHIHTGPLTEFYIPTNAHLYTIKY